MRRPAEPELNAGCVMKLFKDFLQTLSRGLFCEDRPIMVFMGAVLLLSLVLIAYSFAR